MIKDKKTYDNISSSLDNIIRNMDDPNKSEQLDSAIIEFQRGCYTITYDSIKNGFIIEKDRIFNVLEFFLQVNDVDKIEFLKELNKDFILVNDETDRNINQRIVQHLDKVRALANTSLKAKVISQNNKFLHRQG